MIRKHFVPLALLAATISPPAARAGFLFVGENNGTIVSYNTATGTSSLFANLGSQVRAEAFDSSGNLYAATANNAIEKITPGGAVSVFASGGQLSTPSGLAIDGSGNVYVSNYATSTVERFTPGGVGSIFASMGVVGPSGLAFDASGNLYVSNYNISGTTVERFTPGGVGSVFASSGLLGPAGLAFDGSGNLYVANYNNGSRSIAEFTPAGVGSVFASGGMLNNPDGLAFDSSGNLYVANFGGGTIEQFTPGGQGSLFANVPGGPIALAFMPASVPEPSSMVILGIGLIASACGRVAWAKRGVPQSTVRASRAA